MYFYIKITHNITGDFMYNYLLKIFNNSSDLIYKEIDNIKLIYLDSLCDSNKINDYILKAINNNKRIFLRDNITGPSVIYINDINKAIDYLYNGFALIYDDNDMLVCEVKANLYRSIDIPTSESSINGPKDCFNESILINLGLIKRRIKTNKLINVDYELGSITKNKVSILFIDGIVKKKYVRTIKKYFNKFKFNSMCEIEVLSQQFDNKNFFPTVMKTERPDTAVNALLDGKIVIIGDNTPYALILPSFLIDFINPIGDKYVKSNNVNFLKIIRFICFVLTMTLPGIYISLTNFSPETVPLKLLVSFQNGRSGVPFPSYIECVFLILLCSILRESDIRFPSSYGSSISILGALILGEAAVNANVVSPIMIIIVGITFITGLIFDNGDMIDGLRFYRFLVLLFSILFGFYGLIIACIGILVKLCSINSLGEPYLFPLSPFNKKYFSKTMIKRNKQ